ncbi:JNK-interacting protein 3 isoform X2 [Planococcus citri]|uniref:JNK-interacting protein 3 isoform X2 n=1 Tax=Planococcus citri TaxID=170843 RepID=UPI0031F9C093
MDQETVYGANEDSHIVMSEKVQTLAGSIYQEFEKMMAKYDEDVVKDLMPLVVNVLECLDLSYTENQEHEVELELLREDNEQLVTQYEREKQLRKSADQKLLQIEDALEDERKDLSEKVESLESIVRMLELKAKNSSDHVYRLEEKEQEMKKEFAKLHERYTELFKTHMDCMERTKILMGTGDRTDVSARSRLPAMSMSHMSRSSGPISFGFSSLECSTANVAKSINSPVECSTISASPPDSNQSNTSLKNELNAELQGNVCVAAIDEEPSEKGWSETLGMASKDNSPDQELPEDLPPILSTTVTPAAGKSHTKREQRSGNTLYQELSFQDAEALGEMDDGVDITGSWVHPGDYASSGSENSSENQPCSVNDNFFGMGKEVENLIMENNELLATKNALNVVKDDLIMKVDELTSEQEMFKEEIKSLQTLKSKLMQRINELEDEVKCAKEEAEKLAKSNKSDDEEDIPMAQRKRFTRVEMARVLLERNQYKERFMELQEAVRWSEMIRATKNDPALDKKNKHGVFWKFFGSLFSGSGDNRTGIGGGGGGASNTYQKKDMPLGYVHYNAPTYHVSPALETMRRRHINDRRRGFDYFDSNDVSTAEKSRRAIEKKDQFRQVRAHVSKDDGRLRAYGWSLPGNKIPTPAAPPLPSSSSHVPVPVPVYCRPLMEHEPGMKLWCATGVNLSGGRTRDGGDIVGASVFYSARNWQMDEPDDEVGDRDVEPAQDTLQNPEIAKIDRELKEGEQLRMENEIPDMQRLSSLVWICTTTKSVSKVMIIDANNPGDILHTFTVCQAHLLCIASVPGAKESDYLDDSQIYENENNARRVNVAEGGGDDDDDQESDHSRVRRGGDGDSNRVASVDGCGGGDDRDSGIGKITFVSCATGSDVPPTERTAATNASAAAACSPADEDGFSTCSKPLEVTENTLRAESRVHADNDEGDGDGGGDGDNDNESEGEGDSAAGNNDVSQQHQVPLRRLIKEIKEGLVKDGLTDLPSDNDVANEEMEKMSSVLPTIWLGAQSGYIFVHSAVSQWRRCLHSIKLKDSVLSITHILGKVICALADGTIAVFRRGANGQWDLSKYHSVRLGPASCSVRCLVAVHSRIWCGYRNKIHVLDAKTLALLKSFDAHPRKDSQVRQMAWLGDGVWVSIRLDSTLRLYHAHTYEHLQDVDIEPYVSKMLGPGKVGFSFVRITALLISSHRLWIGTGNGVIISVPLSEYAANKVTTTTTTTTTAAAAASAMATAARQAAAGVGVRVYCDLSTSEVTGASFVPYCSMAQAQLSFHGHRDAVKFFVAVPGNGGMSAATSEPTEGPIVENVCENELLPSMLVISGGEGYIDFRTGETEDELEDEENACVAAAKADLCQLIVWQVALPYLNFQR